jgi:hypothetical protein
VGYVGTRFHRVVLYAHVVHGGGRKDSGQGMHKCEMNSGEGSGKPLLNSKTCLENPL